MWPLVLSREFDFTLAQTALYAASAPLVLRLIPAASIS